MLAKRLAGFQKPMRINLLVMLVFLVREFWISSAISDSCPVSRETVEIVEDCPRSEEKWKEAAARKNCSTYDSECGDPDRLVYHCVINAFVNQTLEVCAYWRIIVLGYCTEYSVGGNIIQQSFRANCSQFTENPCPIGYPSTDAYKYPECYELTTKTTTHPEATSTPSTSKATHMNNKKQSNDGSSKDIILPVIIIVVVLVLFLVVLGMIIMWRKEKFPLFRKKDHKMGNEEESMTLRVTQDTEIEERHIAPSGQTIGNGIKTRKIKILDEEVLPEQYLKPEEHSKQDCQELLNLISDGLTGFAMVQSENGDEDTKRNLANLHNRYDNPEFSFSQETGNTLEDDVEQLESFIKYFKKKYCKNRISKE